MKELPKAVQELKRTKNFTKETAPEQIQKEHRTASGVWGKITVISGSLTYVIPDDSTYLLTPDNFGIIEPEKVHFLELEEPVEFYITFYKES